MTLDDIIKEVPHAIRKSRKCVEVDPAGNTYEEVEFHATDCPRCKLEAYAVREREEHSQELEQIGRAVWQVAISLIKGEQWKTVADAHLSYEQVLQPQALKEFQDAMAHREQREREWLKKLEGLRDKWREYNDHDAKADAEDSG